MRSGDAKRRGVNMRKQTRLIQQAGLASGHHRQPAAVKGGMFSVWALGGVDGHAP